MSWLVRLAQINNDTDCLAVGFAGGVKIYGSSYLPHIFLDGVKVANQKLLIISRGPSGSGKSHMSRELAQQYGVPEVFSSDDFMMEEGKYRFDPGKLRENHEKNRQRTEEAMRGGQPVIIVDNTNTKFWEMEPYVRLAQQYGYEVEFKEPEREGLKTPEGAWDVDFLERMQSQPDRDKTLDRNVLERMVRQYEYNPSVETVLNSERPGRL